MKFVLVVEARQLEPESCHSSDDIAQMLWASLTERQLSPDWDVSVEYVGELPVKAETKYLGVPLTLSVPRGT